MEEKFSTPDPCSMRRLAYTRFVSEAYKSKVL